MMAKPAVAFKEYPESDFPTEKACDSCREAKSVFKAAWQMMQAVDQFGSLGGAPAGGGDTNGAPG